MNGREIFNRYGKLIDVICKCAKFLPRFMRVWFYYNITGRGNTGYFVRYVMLRSLIKKCGKNVRIEPYVYVNNYEDLSIGDNTSINAFSYIIASGGVDIGSNVSIAHNCSIVSETHNWQDKDVPISYNEITPTPVKIANDVWIGCGVRIIGPCTIPSRTILAAGAVVKGNLEPNKIYGGVPAKMIKDI